MSSRCIDLANASSADLQALSDACQPASFGMNDTNVYDESYRKARKMDASDFAAKFDPEDSGLLDSIWPDFLSDGGDTRQRVICELYKLNVYGQDSFFKAHKDTPRSDTMFGSLVVVFPTPHEGGALILRENGKEWTYDSAAEVLAGGSPKLGYVAFFSDVEHEVTRVTAGYRVTLTYNLYFNAKSSEPVPPHPSSKESRVGKALKATLTTLLAREDFLPEGGYLGFGLRFAYAIDPKKPVSAIMPSLKGCDAILKIVCEELGLSVNLKALYESHAGYWSQWEDERRPKDKPVLVARDTFWLYEYEGAPVVGRYDEVVETEEVHWITELSKDFNVVKTPFVAYGNEAQMKYQYGMPVLLALVEPFVARSLGQSNSAVSQ
uniref:Prolyl 4-hydroxylase alpha subunit Fe(2+) 2OG dioxygenase domain-containing protein n=1 Tax=Schizophyllum commune (strain H4-8 / FGSC 9210) TaxID=578458 RepID=D8QDV7_SCHCM